MSQKVLVIDDDRINVKIAQLHLQKHGFAVLTANNGEKGLQVAQKEIPDAILLDIEMPEMNGYTFILELQKHSHLRGIPVIVQTAHREMKPIFKFNNVRGYVGKPVNFPQLMQTLTRILSA